MVAQGSLHSRQVRLCRECLLCRLDDFEWYLPLLSGFQPNYSGFHELVSLVTIKSLRGLDLLTSLLAILLFYPA